MRHENRSLTLPTYVPGVDAFQLVSDGAFPRHTHDQFGLGVILSGGHRSWSGQGLVEAGPGHAIMVNPGEVHDGLPVAGLRRVWRMLYFAPDFLGGQFLDAGSPDVEFARPVAADGTLAMLFSHYFRAATAQQPDAMHAEQSGLLLFTYLQSRHSARSVQTDLLRADIRYARQRIDDDPAAPVSLASLAQETGLSRFQLIRTFVRELGITPHAYLMQARVRLVRRLLLRGVGLAQAACDAGFADQSHMTRAFRRQLGVSPGEYRAALMPRR